MSVSGTTWQLLSATERGGEVMSAHLNEAALEHAHAAPAEVFPRGFAFPSQIESLSARAAHLEHSPVVEAVAEAVLVAEAEQPVASRSPKLRARIVKRSIDLVVGLVLCLLSLVVAVALMVGSMLSFRANPLFVQTRVGRYRKHFRVIKIRSLPTATNAYTDKYSLRSEPSTGFGAFIRATHLDEIPQLWLVLIGRMSLVGPRPEMAKLADLFVPHQAQARSPFRPGCTGLWQLSHHSGGLMSESPEYDLFYAEHQSAMLDMWILWRTVKQIAFGGASISLADVPARLCAGSAGSVRSFSA